MYRLLVFAFAALLALPFTLPAAAQRIPASSSVADFTSQTVDGWTRYERPAAGFAIWIPENWREYPWLSAEGDLGFSAGVPGETTQLAAYAALAETSVPLGPAANVFEGIILEDPRLYEPPTRTNINLPAGPAVRFNFYTDEGGGAWDFNQVYVLTSGQTIYLFWLSALAEWEADYTLLFDEIASGIEILSTPVAAPGGASGTTAQPAATATPRPAPTPTPPAQNCHPSYPDFCIPPPPPDLDCGDITQRRFRVLQPDPHDLDRDRDGIGCE